MSYSFKDTFESFIPTLPEFLLFVIICILTVITINLVHYTMIQQRITSESRCLKKGDVGQTVYKVTGNSLTNKPVFTVTYDLSNKRYTIDQVAKTGVIINKVTIPVYNIQMYSVEQIEKIFNCEQNFELNDGNSVLYTGDPELVRFMEFQNTDFFEKKLFKNN